MWSVVFFRVFGWIWWQSVLRSWMWEQPGRWEWRELGKRGFPVIFFLGGEVSFRWVELVWGRVLFLFQGSVVGLPTVEKKRTLLGFFLLFFSVFFFFCFSYCLFFLAFLSGVWAGYTIFCLYFSTLFFLSSLRFPSPPAFPPSMVFFSFLFVFCFFLVGGNEGWVVVESVVVSGAVVVSVAVASVVVTEIVSSADFVVGNAAGELVFFFSGKKGSSLLSGWTSGSSAAVELMRMVVLVRLCRWFWLQLSFEGSFLLMWLTCPAKRPPALDDYHHSLLLIGNDVGMAKKPSLFRQTVRI